MGKKVKISIHDKNSNKAEVLNGYGLAILDNTCIKCESKQDLYTGDYTLDLSFLLDDEGKYKQIEKEMILKVLIDGSDEIFRIVSVRATTRDLQVFARQWTIDATLAIHLGDVRPTSLNGLASLLYMKENSNEYMENKQYAKDLEVFSDITNSSTAYYVEQNMYSALHDCDQSFNNRWGGEILRDGYKLSIIKRVGLDRGFQVRSRKNLTGFEADTSMSGLITRIKPKGFNDITIDGYVSSPLIDKYAEVKTSVITYSDIKVRDENTTEDEEGIIFDTLEEAQKELIKRANLEYSKNHVDEPSASYKVSFVPLEKTEEYKNYAILEKCRLGDTVYVYEEKHDMNITVRCISINYNILTQSISSIELSNQDLTKKITSIETIIKRIETIPDEDGILNEANKNATLLINTGLKNSHVIARTDEILVMDTKDINTAQKVWRWNLNGLGYSSTGYYGEYGTALTNDGKIVADFITTGLLNANVIRAGIIRGLNDNLVINLDTGKVIFKSGLIQGLNSSWNLDTGIFKTTGKDEINRDSTITIGNGKILGDGYNYITSDEYLQLGSSIESDGSYKVDLSLYTAGNSKGTAFLHSTGQIFISCNKAKGLITMLENGEVRISGTSVYINGYPVNSTLSAMQNYMLESEGII